MSECTFTRSSVTRRSLVAGAVAVAACSVAGAAGRAVADDTTSPTTGVFRGTGSGRNGEIVVDVQLVDGVLSDVHVISQQDTDPIAPAAVAQLCPQMVDLQSIEVDVAAGATATSMGIKMAVEDALKDCPELEQLQQPASFVGEPRENEEADVVIVGAGGGGLMAAVTLGFEDFTIQKTEGLKVVVLEKCAMSGGSTALSSGGIAITSGVAANDFLDCSATGDEMVALFEQRSQMELNAPLIKKCCDLSGQTMTQLANLGGPHALGYVNVPGSVNAFEVDSLGKVVNYPAVRVYPPFNEEVTNQGAVDFVHFLEQRALSSGADIRWNSPVVGLIVEDGAVMGVRVQDQAGTYDVRAKKVILACGGFSRNQELMEKYSPDYATALPFSGPGSTGDGFAMVEDLDVVHVGSGAIGYCAPDGQHAMHGIVGSVPLAATCVKVGRDGKRFENEAQKNYNEEALLISRDLGGQAYGIMDSTYAFAKLMPMLQAIGRAYTADTVEDLVQQLDVDQETLLETIGAYNDAFQAGEDDPEFGVAHDSMAPLLEPPFYAFDIQTVTIGTLSGLKVSENCEVLTSTGEPVPNLYAIGEMCAGGNIMSRVYNGGWGVASAIYTGRIAAEHAKEFVRS